MFMCNFHLHSQEWYVFICIFLCFITIHFVLGLFLCKFLRVSLVTFDVSSQVHCYGTVTVGLFSYYTHVVMDSNWLVTVFFASFECQNQVMWKVNCCMNTNFKIFILLLLPMKVAIHQCPWGHMTGMMIGLLWLWLEMSTNVIDFDFTVNIMEVIT